MSIRHFFSKPLVVLGIAVLIFIAFHIFRPQTETIQLREKVWRVEVREVHHRTLSPAVLLYARVESSRTARMHSALNADVTEIAVREGDRITSNQTLVRLDDRDSRLELRLQEAMLREIKAEIQTENQRYKKDKLNLQHEKNRRHLSRQALDRLKRLSKKNFASQVRLDEARDTLEANTLAVHDRQFSLDNYEHRTAKLDARLAQSESERDIAALNLERCHITAPFDGRVTEVFVAPGMRMQPGEPLLEIYDTEGLELRARIPHSYLPSVRAALREAYAMQATATVDDVAIRATLVRLSAEIPENYGSIDGFFQVSRGAEVLEPGRRLNLNLSLRSQEQVISVPFDAIHGTDRLYKLEEGRMRQVTVSRVGELNGEVLIRSTDLMEGDFIILTPLPNAMDGLKVTAMY
uniref:RND family efflux transporter, MFP subunit n=1 Tax=Candidatus Kentrum sp. FM TaxID=2126340 RepID=A0A450TQ67_9GAMM|nr:MAG: RND family efflux transporter, MFP subunit [Candidatus Kentron sp. FM]VFJ70959.1 MAG: RND family efflux transporter, MFP subunit [Candidatus Kentron sp. FM]VFK18576.1 MAG: RND family efflux transporter, MFP subunit [Candidatus Kentron sp. FM]